MTCCMKTKTQGIIYVATVKPMYYGLAIASCKSLKQNYPECSVTLFTHEDWVDEHAEIFDHVITKDVPVHKRAKMWAMARTPYDRTMYIDVDSIVLNKDVKLIFDQIDDDIDFGFVENPPLCAANPKWAFIDKEMTEEALIDGSFMLYNKSDLMIEFLNAWFDEYKKQHVIRPENWPYEFAHVEWDQFDMFTIWRMLFCDKNKFPSGYESKFERYRKLKIKQVDKRFNGVPFIPKKLLNGKRVIIQIPIPEYPKIFTNEWEFVEEIMSKKDEKCTNT